MKYNKVRGILRARNGSQIPKFQNPPGALPKLTFPSLNTNLSSGVSYLNNPYLIGSETATQGKTLDISNLDTSDLKAQVKPITQTMPVFQQSLKKFGNKVGNFAKNAAAKAGEFIEQNPEMVSRGLQLGSNTLFNSVDNGKGFTGVNTGLGVGTQLANSAGMAGLGLGLSGIQFGLNAINKLGSKTLRDFSVDQNVRSNLGGSYSGAYSTIDKGAENSGKELGFFTRKKPYEEAISEAESLQNQLININKETEDRRGRINDLNYLNYNFLLNGGYDQRYMRAKSGGKLQYKIDLLKERKKSLNSIINVQTQEWEPVIDDVEYFKEGGSIDWEPIIEDVWEPVIDDVEVYKEGGSIKEELETPEIEKTNQKNLIPEGALHKNKHHMEHTEGLTQKGIPVIDNSGEQQAEIECDEIVFSLEVTKFLEERYHKYYSEELTKKDKDQLAIEVGKELVYQILHNTDDRTDLISKCKEGGKL